LSLTHLRDPEEQLILVAAGFGWHFLLQVLGQPDDVAQEGGVGRLYGVDKVLGRELARNDGPHLAEQQFESRLRRVVERLAVTLSPGANLTNEFWQIFKF
jgi:hypothetical protein